jgi:hypothetical protein
MSSLGSRIAGTIVMGASWITFIVLWLAFYVGNFDFWQNLAVFIVSITIAAGILAVLWIKWIFG